MPLLGYTTKREIDAWAVCKGETEKIAIFTLLHLRALYECDAAA